MNFDLRIPMMNNSGVVINTKEAKVIRRNAVKSVLKNKGFCVRYIREKSELDRVCESRGTPYGVVISNVDNGRLMVGWSLTHKNDKYDRDFGLLCAMGRMASVDTLVNNKNIPNVVRRNIAYLVARSICYFRGV